MAETCIWSLNTDDEFGMYETTCRNAFSFTDGGPKDNEFRYCCYCGKPLEVNHYTNDGDGDGDDDGEGVTEVLGPSAAASGQAAVVQPDQGGQHGS